MTSPVSVGQVSVEVIASARALAKSLKKEVESAFKDLDVQKMIRDSIGTQKIRVPVQADVDADAIPETVRRTRVPKVPVQLDPVVALFQAEVRRQTAALARQVAVKVPIEADGGRLRAELGAQLAALQAQAKLKVPTEPGAKAEYEAKLKTQLAEVAARVKQHVKVDVDVDKNAAGGALRAIGGIVSGIAKALPNIGGISSGVASLGGALQSAAGSSAQLGGNLAGAAESATGPIGIVIGLLITAAGAMAALAGAATLAVPAISAVAGAAAAIPAALAGIGAVVGTLGLGFHGISEAFAPKRRGGGGGGGQDPAARARQIAAAERGVDAARRGITSATRGLAAAERGLQSAQRGVADAERNVADAQKRATQAQLAVSKARVEATDDIEDLGRALRGAVIDEAQAALAVTDALRDLEAAKLTGNLPDIERANLAYQEAQLTLENATDAAKDLGAQQADATKKGVEGSDKVVAALDAQAQAQQGVRDAQEGVLDAQNGLLSAQDALASANDGLKSSVDGLKSAQDSLAASQAKTAAGGAAAAAKLIKLAPAAQKFVNAIKALKPAFEGLRLDVQQRLFAGLDKTVTHLGDAWIKPLRKTLGTYADTFNTFFKNLGSSVSTPKFVGDIQAGAEGARKGLEKIGTSVTTSLVPAFGALAKAAGPFLDKLGGEIADVVTEFSNWVLQGEKSKSLTTFFDTASRSVHDIFDTGKLVGKIIGDLFSILTGSQFATGKKTPLESFNDGLKKVDKFLSDPKNAAKIKGFLDDVKDKLAGFGRTVAKIDGWVTQIGKFYDALFPAEAKTRANAFGGQIGSFLVAGLIAGIGAAIRANFLSLAGVAQLVVDTFKDIFGIHSPSTVMADIGVNLIEGLIQGVFSKLGDLGKVAGRIKTTVLGQLKNPESWLRTHGGNTVAGFMTGLSSRLRNLASSADQIHSTVTNRLAGAGSWLHAHGQNSVIGFANGVGSRLGALSSYMGNVRVTVQNALVNAGSWLVSAGRNTVYGLWNGMASLGGWLFNKVVNFVRDRVEAAFTFGLSLGSPSKMTMKMGAFVSQGLAIGMESEAGRVKSAAAAIAAAALPSIDPSFGVDLTAATIQGTLDQSAGISISIDRSTTGDWLADGLRKHIKAKHNGSVEKALSTA